MKLAYILLLGLRSIAVKTPKRQRIGLSVVYFRLWLGYLFGAKGSVRTTLVGYRFLGADYPSLFGLFNEIFVERVYDFVSANPAPTIIDCGSNVGLSVLYFKWIYPCAKIVAFEPEEGAFELLQKNVVDNDLKGVHIHRAAVCGQPGSVVLFSELDRVASTGSSLFDRLSHRGRRVEQSDVRGVALSDYVHDRIDLLKMDIEGLELQVLEELAGSGKIGLIQQMILEHHTHGHGPSTQNHLGELLGILERAGFHCLLHGGSQPPYHQHRGKPSNVMVFAYRPESGSSESDHAVAST